MDNRIYVRGATGLGFSNTVGEVSGSATMQVTFHGLPETYVITSVSNNVVSATGTGSKVVTEYCHFAYVAENTITGSPTLYPTGTTCFPYDN